MSNNHLSIAIETPQNWGKSYELIDSGGFEKLEQFGEFVVRRPEPQALWSKSLSEEFWSIKANAHFKKEKGSTERGVWDIKKGVPDKWFIPYQSEHLDLKLKISLSSFKHVGLFPEQASNWEFLAKNIPLLINPKPKILNLFAYTGGASLVCRQMGADVTHVDSVKPVLSWARENMEVSQLDSIRWMAEDALKFVKREARRGNFYQGILLDPPAYGRGPDGEKWVLEEQIDDMLRSVKEILDPKEHILLTNVYSLGFSTLVVENLVNGIEKLMDEGINCTLAVSLHTPDDELRDTLVPINNRFNIREVLAAADAYEKKTGRRYSIEYALIRDINDQSWRSDLLGRLLKNRNAHVNLIPLNPTPGSKWTASRREDEAEFVRILESYGVPVTVRDTRGREIDGACGQLAATEKGKPVA